MKKVRLILCFVALAVASCGTLMAQKTYQYKTYPNDPLNVREYTLDNGLKVFMSVYKDAPKIQTYIAVRAGSKNDPHETTGLAHYLEHMMFKGTERLGTTEGIALAHGETQTRTHIAIALGGGIGLELGIEGLVQMQAHDDIQRVTGGGGGSWHIVG